jgi:hypothetical protein
MPSIKYSQDTYRSVVQPPAGYRLTKTELLRAGDSPSREEEAVYREFGLQDMEFLDGFMVFRCIVEAPDGSTLYTSSVIESLVTLCKREFWEDFWTQVVAAAAGGDQPTP